MADQKRTNSFVFSDALLKDFINGLLEPSVEEKIAAFVESRPELLQKVTSTTGDGFLKRLREVRQRTPVGAQINVQAKAVNLVSAHEDSARRLLYIPPQLANYPGYQVTKELGRGGMGVVYLAKNLPMDRLEVLKVLNERLLDHEGAKERFLREIRAVSKLNHSNIVTSYSVLPLDGLLVFAMEHVQGMDLHNFIHKHRPLSIGLTCSFAKQLAAGLQHAHEKGLVHRDIKPSNAMIYKSAGQLQLKILDFGLAKASSEEVLSALTQVGTMLGTPEYMSPEQTLNAAKADIRADIYSLGCTLYHMLIGNAPFTGTHGEVLMAHAQREATMLNLVRPEVPRELAVIVAKMMAKDVSKRFQTPAEVAKALVPFIQQQKVSLNKAPIGPTAANTLNDLKDPDRETSVEGPKPQLSLDLASRVIAPQPRLVSAAGALGAKRLSSIPASRNRRRRKAKATFPKWFWPTTIAFTSLFSLLALGQLGTFTFRTPIGTIVVENMPADAEVLVDGQRVEISWNAGKDEAVVSIDAGSHQLQVLNQGNEIFGERVSVKGGNATTLTLSFTKNAMPSNAATVKPVGTVPQDAVRFGNQAYKLFPKLLSWDEANKKCIEVGGKLAYPENAEENAFLLRLATDAKLSSLWIGLTDRDSEGKWRQDDGSNIEFANWDSMRSQPNNALGVEHCAVLTTFPGGVWWDYPNNPTLYPQLVLAGRPSYVCQWKSAFPSQQSVTGSQPTNNAPVAGIEAMSVGNPVATNAIPKDATKYNNKYYRVFLENLTWHRAKQECEKLGGRLAEVLDASMNSFLCSLAKRSAPALTEAWLGATDEMREGVWIWTSGKKMEFTNWAPDQPNNVGLGENCLVLVFDLPGFPTFKNKWNDQPTEAKEAWLKPGFICEWDAPP